MFGSLCAACKFLSRQLMQISRSLVKNCPEFIRTSMLTFFNNTAEDLSGTIQNLRDGRYSHLRGAHLKTSTSLFYINDVVLPVLTAMFDHLAGCEYGGDLLLDEIQVASYKMLGSLYTLGIDSTLTHDRKYLKTEIERHRPQLGTCLGAYSSTFPVAYLEPHLNKHNQFSLVNRIAEHSLEAQDILARMESQMPTLDSILQEVDQFVESEKTYTDAPHIIDVIMPMLCSYLPVWWNQGPDNISLTAGNYVTMVTSEHMNQLLKNVLKMIKKNIGNENAPWMTRIAAYTQQIIINSLEELLKDPFLPLAERVKKRTDTLFHKEESLRGFLKSSTDDTSQVESQIQEDWHLLVRDIYSFYPLLIKYVDLQRNHWMRNNIPEAEDLYNHVAEIFNIWSKSQYFLREEQNFISANEIDNMVLIMPTATRRSAVVSEGAPAGGGGGKKKKKHRDKKRDKDKELQASLMVACLKRLLLPVGLNLFAGREQELVQHCKDRYLKKMPEYDIVEFAKTQLTLPDKIDPGDEMSWQHYLYSKLGSKKDNVVDGQTAKPQQIDETVDRIVAMAKVLFGLHMIDHPQLQSKTSYRSVVSTQRKRAVIACFRQLSLHALPSMPTSRRRTRPAGGRCCLLRAREPPSPVYGRNLSTPCPGDTHSIGSGVKQNLHDVFFMKYLLVFIYFNCNETCFRSCHYGFLISSMNLFHYTLKFYKIESLEINKFVYFQAIHACPCFYWSSLSSMHNILYFKSNIPQNTYALDDRTRKASSSLASDHGPIVIRGKGRLILPTPLGMNSYSGWPT